MADKTPPPPEDESSEAPTLPPGGGDGGVPPEYAETFIQEPGPGGAADDDSEAPTLPPQRHPDDNSEAVTLPPQTVPGSDQSEAVTLPPQATPSSDDSEALTLPPQDTPSADQSEAATLPPTDFAEAETLPPSSGGDVGATHVGDTVVEKPDTGDFDPYEAATMAPAEDDATIAEGSSTLADRNAQHATRFTTLPKNAPKAYPGAPEIHGYHIFDRLGEGGMGVVWKAIQIGTRREVALKLLPSSTIGSEKAQIRFQREIKTAAAAEHPYIASIYDSGLDKGVFYYAMQCIDGEELNIYARQKKLDIRQSIELMQKVIRGMQYAHENNIIHRDLKPGNVMVTKDGDPKLLDFGLAKSTTDVEDSNLSMVGEVMGTPMYMSTEQARGMTDLIDGRTDIYSLGIMLYELITGDFPYSSEGGPFEIIRRKIESDPIRPRAINKDIDIDLEAIVLKSIALDRDERYTTAREFDEDLQRYLEGRPVLARRHTFSYVSYKFLKRNSLRIAIVLLIASGAGAGYTYLDQQRRADVAAQEAEKEKLAKETERLAKENAEKVFNDYNRTLDSLETAIGEGDPDGAAIHLATLAKITTPEAAAEIETRFGERRDTLKEQLAGLEARRTEMQAERASLIKAWTEVQAKPLNNLSTLTPAFAHLLTGIQETFKDSTYLNEEDIAARRKATGDLLLATLSQAIQPKPLGTRSARLKDATAFLNHPGITKLFPQLAPVHQEARAAAQLCLVEVQNSWDYDIRVRLANGETADIAKGQKHLLSFPKPASGDTLTLQAESLHETDLHEELQIDIPFKAGAGLEQVVRHFGKRRITVEVDRKDLPVVAFFDTRTRVDGGRFEKRVRDTQFLPGDYWILFKREDYQDKYVPINLALPQQTYTIAAPAEGTWELKFHVSKYREAEGLFKKGALDEALAALATVNTAQLSGEDSGWIGKFKTFTTTIENDPRLLVDRLYPDAHRAIDAFLRAFVQIHEPGGSIIKPFRYEKGDVPIPTLDLRDLSAREMALLTPEQNMHYAWIKTWQSALRKGGALDTIRSEAVGVLSAFGQKHPGLALDTQAAIEVLSRDKKGKLEKDIEERINHPLILRWKANNLLKGMNNASDSECLKFLDAAVSGSTADQWDLRLACYATAHQFNSSISAIRLEGLTHGNPGFKIESDASTAAFRTLEKCFQNADAAAVASCIAYLEAYATKNPDTIGYPDLEVGYAISRMNLSPEISTLCREAYAAARERHRANLPPQEWKKVDQRVIALSSALSAAE